MARRKHAKRPPNVILNPGIVDDSDEDPPTLGIPDEDGWVYLKRSAKPKEGKPDGQEKRRRRKA